MITQKQKIKIRESLEKQKDSKYTFFENEEIEYLIELIKQDFQKERAKK